MQIFTARLKRLRKNTFVRLRFPSAAKAVGHFERLTARLDAAPFQNRGKGRVFPQRLKSCPSRSRVVARLRSIPRNDWASVRKDTEVSHSIVIGMSFNQ